MTTKEIQVLELRLRLSGLAKRELHKLTRLMYKHDEVLSIDHLIDCPSTGQDVTYEEIWQIDDPDELYKFLIGNENIQKFAIDNLFTKVYGQCTDINKRAKQHKLTYDDINDAFDDYGEFHRIGYDSGCEFIDDNTF